MRHHLRALAALCVFALLSVNARADGSKPIPASDFARPAQLTLSRLSPSGDYLALVMRDKAEAEEGSTYSIVVFHVSDMKPTGKVNVPERLVPDLLNWVSDTRLIAGFAEKADPFEEPRRNTSLLAVDYDGSHQKILIGAFLNDAECSEWAGIPEQPNGHFYCLAYKDTGDAVKEGTTKVYDVDSVTGKHQLLTAFNSFSGMQFVFHDGVPLIAYGLDDKASRLIYTRPDANQPWKKIDVEGDLIPLRFSADGKHIYWLHSREGAPYQLTLTDSDLSHRQVLAADTFGDIDEDAIEWTSYPQKPFAVTVKTGRPKTTYIDDDNWATIHKALSEQYPDYVVHFVNMSADGSRILIQAYSDRDPGFLALFTLSPVSLKVLYHVLPWIDPQQMAARTPIRFKASDGLELDGYLTLPARGKNLPMVLLPHGGPLFIRDTWEYDAEAQFLASRGYAVLQVNYRGSDGRGQGFIHAGARQFATGIQQDLIDGVHWAIDNGYADKNRVCVYGTSFGGYAALMAPIRAPGLFKCSIDFAGISDYSIEFQHSDTHESAYGRNYFDQIVGTDDANIKAISPIYHLDQFNVPVLIVHGEKDERVPIKNAKELRDALDKAGKPYEWLVKPKEGHGFYSEANNTEFLQRMEQFLNKYIGAGSDSTANAVSATATTGSISAH